MHKAIGHHPLPDAQTIRGPKAGIGSRGQCLPILCTEHDILSYGIALQWAGVSCPVCVPSQLPVHLQPAGWQEWEADKSLT